MGYPSLLGFAYVLLWGGGEGLWKLQSSSKGSLVEFRGGDRVLGLGVLAFRVLRYRFKVLGFAS